MFPLNTLKPFPTDHDIICDTKDDPNTCILFDTQYAAKEKRE